MNDLKKIRDQYEANGFNVFPHDLASGIIPKGYLDPGNYPFPDYRFRGMAGLAIAANNGILGVDVDAYDGKNGGDTLTALAEEVGEKFPDTYSSTARGEGQPSRIYYVQVPQGIKFKDQPGIEMVHETHRFAKVYPTVNPKTGTVYRWFTPDGAMMPESELPLREGLPWLSDAWIEKLRRPERISAKSGTLELSYDDAIDRMLTDGEPCSDLADTLDYYREKVTRGDSHYGSAVESAWAILNAGDEGHRGARSALETLRGEYVAYATSVGRDGDEEFDRLIESVPDKMHGITPDDERMGCGGMLGCGVNPHPDLVNVAPVDPDMEILRGEDGTIPATWAPADLSFLMLNDWQDRTPLVGSLGLGDDRGLFYVGKTNTIVGDPEAGKSWIAQKVVQETLSTGGTVLYLDHESDARAVCTRLALLGATVAELSSGRFTYVNPAVGNRKVSEIAAWKQHIAAGYDLVVIDGVTAAVAITGGSTNSQDDVAKWWNEVPKPLEFTGACVITIDHTTKAGTERRGALGSIIKVALVSGISYMLIAEEPLAPGKIGSSRLRIDKDRPGRVARHAWIENSARMVGTVTVDSTDDRDMQIYIDDAAPVFKVERTRDNRRQKILDALVGSDGMSKTAIADTVRGRRAEVMELIDGMAAEGELSEIPREGRGGGSLYKLSADPVLVPVPCLIDTGTTELVTGGSNSSSSTSSNPFPELVADVCPGCGVRMESAADGSFCPEFCEFEEAA